MHFLGAGVVGHVQPGLHLDHGSHLTTRRRRFDVAVCAASALSGFSSPASSSSLAAARMAAMSTAWLLVTTRTSSQRFSLRARAGTRRSRPCRPRATRSFSSCTWQTVLRRRILPYLAMPDQPRDLDAAGLGHLVAGHDADGYSLGHGSARLVDFVLRRLLRCLGGRLGRSLGLNRLDAGRSARRCFVNSLGASSRSVCAWMRRRNRFSAASFERQLELLVAHLAKFGWLWSWLDLLDSRLSCISVASYIARRFKNRTRTGILWASRAKHIRAASSGTPPISNSTVPGLTTAAQNSGSPFALAHAGFERDRGDRLVREDADVQPAFAAQVLLRGDAAGLDRLRAEPAALRGLQAEVAERPRGCRAWRYLLYVLFGFFGA